jgi:hypothetical protein
MPIDPAEITKPSQARAQIVALIDVPAAKEMSLICTKN